MTTESATDRSVGLGLVFSVVALVATAATGAFGYRSAITHGTDGASAQVLSGIAFGAAVLVGIVAIVAVHVYAK